MRQSSMVNAKNMLRSHGRLDHVSVSKATITLNQPPHNKVGDGILSPSFQSQCAVVHQIWMSHHISPSYWLSVLSELLRCGMGATHPIISHRNFLPFQCMPPAAACSFIFANASHGRGLGWQLKPRSTELPDLLATTWTNHVVSKRYPPKQNHKINSKLSWKNETWRNSMSKFRISTDSFRNLSPFDLRGFRCQETWPCFFWHLTMWFMGSGCQTFHLELMYWWEADHMFFLFSKLKHIMDPVNFFQFSFRSQVQSCQSI